VRML